ncbi:MAG TPA: dehydrogenase [Bacteroidales bacterium]|nr:MAG: Nitroreductase [Bacteroidetes bacterium 38_7]HAL65475.1 dehydrogenase [Bacteroidales bacterium]HAW59236.1 dehydrogenase [Bacteroidales bacterium]
MSKIVRYVSFLLLLLTSDWLKSQQFIQLNPPDLTRGRATMQALSLRASATQFDTTMLSLQDLSDVLWAANGINRPASGKRTSPSAMNAQDIDIYTFIRSGVYLYNPQKHALELVVNNDYRRVFLRDEKSPLPPVILLLVSDISRFRTQDDSLKMMWGAMDAGIVSENISVFCASENLATRPRASMNQKKLRELLNLKDSQYLMLNHPVSYKKNIGN